MPGKVFVSCGQSQDEMDYVRPVSEWLESEGFEPYVALAAQSLSDIDAGVIAELRSADYFIFIDFKRERVAYEGCGEVHRGSLYAHQELALAHAFGFPHCIFLRESGVESEGMAKFIQVNPVEFSERADVLPRVQKAIAERGWSVDYSRQLVVPRDPGKSGNPYLYRDHARYGSGIRSMRVISWGVPVENRRADQPAFHAVARLVRIVHPGGREQPSPDRSCLKWGGAVGYDRTIFPNGYEDIDAISLNFDSDGDFYLHSARDISPRGPIIHRARGTYRLHYEVCAFGFPSLEFALRLIATADWETTQVVLC